MKLPFPFVVFQTRVSTVISALVNYRVDLENHTLPFQFGFNMSRSRGVQETLEVQTEKLTNYPGRLPTDP